MKLLLLGSTGQLGRAFHEQLSGGKHEFQTATRRDLDLRFPAQIEALITATRPDSVINCMAYTDVNAAESSPAEAFSVNADGVAHLAQACHRVGATLVHFSTDYVFDGAKHDPYTETAIPNPLNEYGKSKWQGEQHLNQSPCRALILRTSWVYGHGTNNFVYRLQQWAQSRDTLRIVDDEWSVPSSTHFLAHQALCAIEQGLYGLFHLVPKGSASRYEFAQAIRTLCPKITAEIEPAKSTEFPSEVRRPGYSVMSPLRMETALNVSLPSWQECLNDFLSPSRRPE